MKKKLLYRFGSFGLKVYFILNFISLVAQMIVWNFASWVGWVLFVETVLQCYMAYYIGIDLERKRGSL